MKTITAMSWRYEALQDSCLLLLVRLVSALGVSYRGLCATSVLGDDWRARRRLQQLSRTPRGELVKLKGGGKVIDHGDLPHQS